MDFSEKPKCDNSSNASTYKELLEWRQQLRDMELSEHTSLQGVVLKLIDHHQDFDQVFEELIAAEVNTCSEMGFESAIHLSVDMLLSCLHAQAQQTSTPIALLAAQSFAKYLEAIVMIEPADLLNDVQQHQVMILMEVIKKLNRMHSFNHVHFIKNINSKCLLPVELVWILHRESVMTLDKFITNNLGKKNVFAALSHGIVEVGLNVPTDEKAAIRNKHLVQGFASFLVAHGYSASCDDILDPVNKVAVQKASMILLDTIMKDFFNKGSNSTTSNCLNLLQLIRQDRIVDQKSKINFFKRQLIQQLTSSTDIIVSQAISDQHLWTFAKTSTHVTAAYCELLLFFEEKEVGAMIQSLLEHEEVNWHALLSFVSTFLVVCSGALTVVKELIHTFLSVACDEMYQDFLIIALLLARQAAAEGPQIFPLYTQWFKETFGERNTYITSKKSFTFLMKILTSLVPFESAHTLKAHIQSPPYAFPKCQDILCDYILLAKTRIADLKGTSQLNGNFSEKGSIDGPNINKKQIESDVEQAVTVFEETNQIPHSIIEASIFKYPYFMGRFLPVLLTPRMLPDVPDSKMKLIEMLKNLGKIPMKMMEKYKVACEKEFDMLLEGIDMEEDDCDNLEPMDALKRSMDNFVKATIKFDTNTEGLNHQLAIISERLQTLLSSESGTFDLSTKDKVIALDLQTPSLTQLQVQVTETILNGFCRACREKEKSSIHWADKFVLMISQFQPVLESLMLRICTMLLYQGPQLELAHLHSLSMLLVHLHRKQDFIPLVNIISHRKINEIICDQFLSALGRLLKNDTGENMKFLLQLSTAIIRYSMDLNESSNMSIQVIPEILLGKFLYLVPRLYPDARYSNVNELNAVSDEPIKVYLSQIFIDFCDKHSIKINLNQWIHSELTIQPHLDCITFLERKEYYRWIINEKFFFECPFKHRICSTFFMELVDYSKTTVLGLRVHNGCLHYQSQNAVNKDGNQGEMLQLLQEICQSSNFKGSADKGIHENFSWLMNAVQKRLQQTKNRQLEMACIMNIVTSLPAHLLVSNTPDLSSTTHSIKNLISFVNMDLRQNLMETVCSLPFHITSYFARLLSNLSKSSIHQLKKACPLLMSSFLKHVNKIIASFSRSICSSTLELLKNLSSLKAHAAEIMSSGLTEFSMQDGDMWLLCVALLNLPEHQLCSSFTKLVKSEQILKHFFELLIADMAYSISNGRVVSATFHYYLSQNILEICPECLTILTNVSVLTSCIAQQTVVQLMPLALFRVYLEIPMSVWIDHVNKPSVLQSILIHHQLLVNLYTKVDLGYFNHAELISLKFMTCCSKFITSLVSKTQCELLKRLNSDVLQKATPEIQSEIKKILL